jgi:ribonuclease HI
MNPKFWHTVVNTHEGSHKFQDTGMPRTQDPNSCFSFHFAGARIYCKLFNLYLSLGQHETHFDGEIEAMTTALIQLFGRTGSFEKAVTFSDSTSAKTIDSKIDALSSKVVTESHSLTKMLKGLQKDTTFLWIPYHFGVVANEAADYPAKKAMKISQTSACKLKISFCHIKRKRSIHADLSEYYAIQSQCKSWHKGVKKRYIIPDFPKEMLWQQLV